MTEAWIGSQPECSCRGRRSSAWQRAASSSGFTGVETTSSAPARSARIRMLSAPGGAMPTTYESVSSRMVSNKLPPCGLGSWRSTMTTSGVKDVARVRAAGPSVVALTENPRARNAAEATRRNNASLTATSTRGASCASGSIWLCFPPQRYVGSSPSSHFPTQELSAGNGAAEARISTILGLRSILVTEVPAGDVDRRDHDPHHDVRDAVLARSPVGFARARVDRRVPRRPSTLSIDPFDEHAVSRRT